MIVDIYVYVSVYVINILLNLNILLDILRIFVILYLKYGLDNILVLVGKVV